MSPNASKKIDGLATDVSVAPLSPLVTLEKGKRPAHHLDDKRGKFANPWPSFRVQTAKQWAGFFLTGFSAAPAVPQPSVLTTMIPSQTPTWGVAPENANKIKATWLGHASFLVELPAPAGAERGPRILFDPALSERCFAVQWAGPARFTNMPCDVLDIPAVDAVVISHNHYDHLDAPSLRTLQEAHNPHIFFPLGNESLIKSLAYDSSHAHSLDWWDQSSLSLSLPASKPGAEPVKTEVTLACTPAQHIANRTPFDRGLSLWASWAVSSREPGSSVYFGGDTGYRTVRDGEDEEAVPKCPAFKEIGENLGGFDLALLPIGAYAPRSMWSCVHASPADAVEIFKDVRAKRALGMHWGTWTLTSEPVDEPPKKLREACERAGISSGVFDVCALGETRVF